MKKSVMLALISILFLTSFCFGATTYSLDNPTATLPNYSGTATTVTVNLTVTRSAKGSATPIYLLVSGANIDWDYLAGERRVYRGGSIADSSMRMYIYPSTGTTEIGTSNTSGTVATSATFATNSFTRTVAVKFTTGIGKVPSGTYTNTFQFQLYTGSLLPGSGTLQSGVVGSISVSVASTTGNTFTMSLSPSTINFGSALLPGDTPPTQSVTMTVTAPSNFSISAQSAYLGMLVSASSGESFAYHLYFNGSATESDLTNGIVKLLTSATAVTNVSYPLSLKADQLVFPLQGTYTDSLVIAFSTQ